jgi:mannose-1-phosphate guanylyltransferase
MISETAARLHPLLAPEKIYTIADRDNTQVILDHLPEVPTANLLVEPDARNTAPCLMLGTAVMYADDPESVLAVLPADHAIRDGELFRTRLRAGAEAASSEESLITFGIPPTYPATGYGYIRFSPDSPKTFTDSRFFPVREFKEKPDAETAAAFCRAGEYSWNSGMFLWRAGVFARQLAQFAPELHAFWGDLLDAVRREDSGLIAELYGRLPATSIDYALMEKSGSVLMGEGDFGWSDVGAWSALPEFWPPDDTGNTLRGPGKALDSRGCLVYNPEKFTALIGVDDLIVVETEDALLICRKDQDQRVKELVAELRKGGKGELL